MAIFGRYRTTQQRSGEGKDLNPPSGSRVHALNQPATLAPEKAVVGWQGLQANRTLSMGLAPFSGLLLLSAQHNPRLFQEHPFQGLAPLPSMPAPLFYPHPHPCLFFSNRPWEPLKPVPNQLPETCLCSSSFNHSSVETTCLPALNPE